MYTTEQKFHDVLDSNDLDLPNYSLMLTEKQIHTPYERRQFVYQGIRGFMFRAIG